MPKNGIWGLVGILSIAVAVLAWECCFPPILLAGWGAPVRVIDGDTLELGHTRIRLYGIDAPESHQNCRNGSGYHYPCGKEATQALRTFIGDRKVTCSVRDQDKYGRSVAVCRAGKEEINRWMVRSGWAVAYVHYAKDYLQEEAEAKADHRGIWSGIFLMPWEWRKAHHP